MFFRGLCRAGSNRGRQESRRQPETLSVPMRLRGGLPGAPFVGRFYLGPLWTCLSKAGTVPAGMSSRKRKEFILINRYLIYEICNPPGKLGRFYAGTGHPLLFCTAKRRPVSRPPFPPQPGAYLRILPSPARPQPLVPPARRRRHGQACCRAPWRRKPPADARLRQPRPGARPLPPPPAGTAR